MSSPRPPLGSENSTQDAPESPLADQQHVLGPSASFPLLHIVKNVHHGNMDSQPSPAATLPPEILEMIFEYSIAMVYLERDRYIEESRSLDSDKRDSEAHRKMMRQPRITRDFALVCRSWRGTAQRILFCKGRIDYTSWHACAAAVKSNPDVLGPFVRSMRIGKQVGDRKIHPWTAHNLSDFLHLFPRLTTLHLSLSERGGGPGSKGDYSALGTLPHLQHLFLRSDKFDKDLVSYRQILLHTPNITSLSLENDRSLVHTLSAGKKIAAVNLPHLIKLTLVGSQLTRMFDKLKLLDESTLQNVIKLYLEGPLWVEVPALATYNVGPLLQQIGTQLRTIGLAREGAGGIPVADILQHCPNVSTVEGVTWEELSVLTPSVRTLNFNTFPRFDDTTTSLDRYLRKNIEYLGNLDTLKITTYRENEPDPDGGPTDFAKQTCVANGIKLVINGVTVDLRDVVED